MRAWPIITTLLAGLHSAYAEPHQDILRMLDGGVLHGEFGGISKQKLLWQREDIEEHMRVDAKSINQVIFSKGLPTDFFPLHPTVHLINQDEIPGKIISLNAEYLILDSPLAGELRIPRNLITRLEPNPHGGLLHYAGPFSKKGWLMLTEKPIEHEENEAKLATEEPEKTTPPWIYTGALFYSKSYTPLIRHVNLPDKGRLRFKVAWKNRLTFSLAFHCDFQRPVLAEPAEDGEKLPEDNQEQPEDTIEFEKLTDLVKGDAYQNVPWLEPNNTNQPTTFGTGYILTLHSSYPILHRCHFNEDGHPVVTNLRTSRSRYQFDNNDEAEFDIRFDREKNSIVLYADQEYVAQWNDIDGFIGKGNTIGFMANKPCELRLSDIRVTAWNGMKDSALSMEHDDRDIVLLTNGTDRFSGQITDISSDTLTLETSYASMELPLSDVSDIRFRQSGIADPEQIEWPSDTSLLYFYPSGRLSLTPIKSDTKTLTASSPLLGPNLSVDLGSATLLELRKNSNDLDEWFDEF